MGRLYTARYEPISTGYMGQLLEWPQVISEGRTLEECRSSLLDAAKEMSIVYREDGLPIPEGAGIVDRLLVEA